VRRGLPSLAEMAGQGPKRAILLEVVPDGKTEIRLCFNPTEYKIEKKNQFAEIAVPGLQSPLIQFVRGESERLTAELMADTSDSLKDVREEFVRPLRRLMRKNQEKHAPPIVRFIWADKKEVGDFQGVIERLDVTYVLFSPEGIPLRAKLGITLLKHQTVADMIQEEKTNSPDVEKTWVARRGDTLAGVSAAVYQDPRLWRAIASANGIVDPRRLRPGTVLTVPRLR